MSGGSVHRCQHCGFPGHPDDWCAPIPGAYARPARGFRWSDLTAEIAEDFAAGGCRFTYADPEPPDGSIVQDGQGRHWHRGFYNAAGSWGHRWSVDGSEDGPFEYWATLTAEKYQPLRIIQAVRKEAT